MPLRAHRSHEIAARFVDVERRIDIEVQLDQLIDDRVPLVAVGRGSLLPESAGFSEAILLVVVVVVARVVLNRSLGEERFGQAVPMLHPA